MAYPHSLLLHIYLDITAVSTTAPSFSEDLIQSLHAHQAALCNISCAPLVNILKIILMFGLWPIKAVFPFPSTINEN